MVHVSFNKGDAVRRRTLWHIHRSGEFSLSPFYIHKCFSLSLSFYVLIILFHFFFFFLLYILLLVLMRGYVSECDSSAATTTAISGINLSLVVQFSNLQFHLCMVFKA